MYFKQRKQQHSKEIKKNVSKLSTVCKLVRQIHQQRNGKTKRTKYETQIRHTGNENKFKLINDPRGTR